MSVRGTVIRATVPVIPASLGPHWMNNFSKYLNQAHAAGVPAATLFGMYGNPAENKTAESNSNKTSTANLPANAASNATTADHVTAHEKEPLSIHERSASMPQTQHKLAVEKSNHTLPIVPDMEQNSSLPSSKGPSTAQTLPANVNGVNTQATPDGDNSTTHPLHNVLQLSMALNNHTSTPTIEPITATPTTATGTATKMQTKARKRA